MADRPVLQVCVFGGSGGVEHHVLALARALAIETETVVVAGESGWLATAAKAAGLRVLTVPEPRGNFDVATVSALRTILKSHREWIVHSHLGRSDWYVWLAALGVPDIRLVTTEHGISAERQDLFVRGVKRILHEYAHALRLRRTNAVVAVSRTTALTLVKRYPVLETRPPVVIAPGIDTTALRGIERAPRPAGSPLRVVVVSRLSPEKGVDVALRGFSTLVQRGVPARLTVVGGGPEEPALRTLASGLSGGDTVRFTGSVADVTPLLVESDVFLMTSRSENLPMALLEALAAGLPAVATSVGGIPELLQDSGAAILVAPEDPAAVADALAALAADGSMRQAMGVSARNRASDYDMGVTVDCLRRVYESLR